MIYVCVATRKLPKQCSHRTGARPLSLLAFFPLTFATRFAQPDKYDMKNCLECFALTLSDRSIKTGSIYLLLPDAGSYPVFNLVNFFIIIFCTRHVRSADYPDLSKHHNIMKNHLTPGVYSMLRDKVTPNGITLDQCIQTGVDNVGHPFIKIVGLVAGDEESYEVGFVRLIDCFRKQAVYLE